MQARSRYYFTNKGRIKSARRVGVQDDRSILIDKDLAKSTARRQVTLAIDGRRKVKGYATTDGRKIKESMLQMVDTLGAPPQYRDMIMSYDSDTLAKMYQVSSLAFDVFYNYEGVSRKDGYYTVDERKYADLEWFDREYKRFAATA